MIDPPRYFTYKYRAHRPIAVGTRVKILPGFELWRPWVQGMGALIGKVGIVDRDGHREGIAALRVKFEDGETWWFLNPCLEVLRD